MATKKDPGQAEAKANKEELDSTLTTDDGRDVEKLRARRGEVIEELGAESVARDKAELAAQKKAGQGQKIDDAGAVEQLRTARESNIELENELAELTGPPVVAPVIEDSPGSFKIISRSEGSDEGKAVKEARFVGWNLHIVGEDFQAPGEVIIDIRREQGWDHQRFSYWTDSGMVDVVVPGLNGPGDWLIHLETLVTKVGEGNEDGLPLVLATDEVALTLY